MNILYVHGYGSVVDKAMTHPKYLELSKLGTVHAIAHDYSESYHKILGDTINYVIENDIDLIVGTSMGGWVASHVGAETGVPFVSLNPSITPSTTLKKYDDTKMTCDEYPDFNPHGFGVVFVESGDDVIDPKETVSQLNGHYPVNVIDGGSHKFESLCIIIKNIKEFYENSLLVNGF